MNIQISSSHKVKLTILGTEDKIIRRARKQTNTTDNNNEGKNQHWIGYRNHTQLQSTYKKHPLNIKN